MKARSRSGIGQTVMLRTYGVVFLLVLALLVGLSVAVYHKAFTDVVTRDAARPTGSATSSRRRPTSSCAA